MTLEAGVRLGAYEVLSPLGAGGMGEVYRARDTRLGREVAIKVLPEELAQDRDRLSRFEQEARAASALNHPNIITIHEVGFEGTHPFLAMELVDGRSLRELVVSGALPIRRVLGIGTQIAEGLAKAHAAGIVHRDLKPENVMVSKDGFVKILDFGLAKLAEPESGGVSVMPTLAKPETRPGVVMGTVGYMSPEQASGEPLDYRSDQFSLGAILYEMATGQKAFQRKTAAETMSAIIRDEPEPIGKLRPDLPAPLRWILERCLAKDREERYTSTRDLARELAGVRDHISEVTSGAEAMSGTAPLRRRVPRLALAIGLLAAGALAGWLVTRARRPEAAPAPSFQRLTFRSAVIANARFAPDGKTVLYGATIAGEPKLYQVRIGSPESQLVGLGAADIYAVSGKGEMAVKFGPGPVGTLARAPLLGGAPRPYQENIYWAGADWAPDGSDLAIVRVVVPGRHRLEFPPGRVLAEGYIGCPRISPRGDWIAFVDAGRLVLIDRDGKQRKTITTGSPSLECPMAWRPDAKEIWFGASVTGQQPALYAVDLEGHLRLVARFPGTLELFDISREGSVLLAHHTVTRVLQGIFPGATEERDIAWLDRSVPAQLSRDGRLLLFTEEGEASPKGPSMYLRPTDGSPAIHLGEGTALALSRDQQWVLALVGEPPQLQILPTGAGQTRRLASDGFEFLPGGDWLADGSGVVFAASEKGAPPRIYLQNLDGGPPRPLTPPGFSFRAGQRGYFANPVSPDGRFVYGGDPSGVGQIFPIAGGNAIPIPALVEGERPCQWTADGRSLYLVSFATGIQTLDLATGRKQFVRKVKGGEYGPSRFMMTPDGRSHVVAYDDVASALYAVDGLR